MSGLFLTDQRLQQHNETNHGHSAVLPSHSMPIHQHDHNGSNPPETTSVADTVLSVLRLEEMVPSGILDGDSIWEEPARSYAQQFHPQNSIHQHAANYAPLSNSGRDAEALQQQLSHPHLDSSNGGFVESQNLGSTRKEFTYNVNAPDFSLNPPSVQGFLDHGHETFASTKPPSVIMQAWAEGEPSVSVNHSSNGDTSFPRSDLWAGGIHPVSLPPANSVHAQTTGDETAQRSAPSVNGTGDEHRSSRVKSSTRSSKHHHKRSSRQSRRRSSRHSHHKHHGHHSTNGTVAMHSDSSPLHFHPVASVPAPLPQRNGSHSHSNHRHRAHLHHHHHHHHHHHEHRSDVNSYAHDEKTLRKEWEKDRNRSGYRARHDSHVKFPDGDVYADRPMPTQDIRHRHRGRTNGSRNPAPSNDFMHKDPAIHSVTFKPLTHSPSSSGSTKNARSVPPRAQHEVRDVAPQSPPQSARVRKEDKPHPEEDATQESSPDLLSTPPEKTPPSELVSEDEASPKQDDVSGVAPPSNAVKKPPKNSNAVKKPNTVGTTTQILRAHRATSEFIAGIERNSDDEVTNAPLEMNIDDPLSALARIAPTSNKLPTILQDERAVDETIFQDEEFKFYRETNMPLGVANEVEEIRHTRVAPRYDEWEKNDVVDAVGDTEDTGDIVAIPRGVKRGRSRPRMNYFVALRVLDNKIKRGVTSLQKRLTSAAAAEGVDIARACIDPSTIHMTLNALHLGDEDMVFDVIQEFNRFGETTLQRLVPTKISAQLKVSGVSTFRNRVLYASITRDAACDVLENVAIALRTMFGSCGVKQQSSSFDPHITIMKMSRISRDERQVFSDALVSEAKAGGGLFGVQFFHSLDLCSMVDDRDDDDYYTTVATIAPKKAC